MSDWKVMFAKCRAKENWQDGNISLSCVLSCNYLSKKDFGSFGSNIAHSGLPTVKHKNDLLIILNGMEIANNKYTEDNKAF